MSPIVSLRQRTNLPGFYQIHTWVRRSQALVIVEFHSTLSSKEYQLSLHYPIKEGTWHDVETHTAYLNEAPKTKVTARKACFPESSMLGSIHESSNKVIQRLCKPNCSRQRQPQAQYSLVWEMQRNKNLNLRVSLNFSRQMILVWVWLVI